MRYRVAVIAAAALFVGGIVLGVLTRGTAMGFLARDLAALQELSRVLAGLPGIVVAIVIFAKNVSALLVSFAFSPLLCLMPVTALTINGWLLGFVAANLVQRGATGLLLSGILPHGILEIPAFIIGEAAAIMFGTLLILAVFRRETRPTLLPRLKVSLRYLVVAVALLLPAAFIEAFVTAALVKGA